MPSSKPASISYIALLAIMPLAAACAHREEPTQAEVSEGNSGNHDLAFIQAACGGCHAVEVGYLSPNPQAPRWEDLANREGLSEETLANWLYDAHNYPEIMDFDLDPVRAKKIADYILQMRSEDYRPLPE